MATTEDLIHLSRPSSSASCRRPNHHRRSWQTLLSPGLPKKLADKQGGPSCPYASTSQACTGTTTLWDLIAGRDKTPVDLTSDDIPPIGLFTKIGSQILASATGRAGRCSGSRVLETRRGSHMAQASSSESPSLGVQAHAEYPFRSLKGTDRTYFGLFEPPGLHSSPAGPQKDKDPTNQGFWNSLVLGLRTRM